MFTSPDAIVSDDESLPELILLALLLVIAIRIALRVAGRDRRTLVRSFVVHGPRYQFGDFVRQLRDFAFKNPAAAKAILFSESADAMVRKMWQDAKGPPRNIHGRISDCRPTVCRCIAPAFPTAGQSRWSNFRRRSTSRRRISPPSSSQPTSYSATIRFGARDTTRFFYVNRGNAQTGRVTDLCGWTSDGQERWYNVSIRSIRNSSHK